MALTGFGKRVTAENTSPEIGQCIHSMIREFGLTSEQVDQMLTWEPYWKADDRTHAHPSIRLTENSRRAFEAWYRRKFLELHPDKHPNATKEQLDRNKRKIGILAAIKEKLLQEETIDDSSSDESDDVEEDVPISQRFRQPSAKQPSSNAHRKRSRHEEYTDPSYEPEEGWEVHEVDTWNKEFLDMKWRQLLSVARNMILRPREFEKKILLGIFRPYKLLELVMKESSEENDEDLMLLPKEDRDKIRRHLYKQRLHACQRLDKKIQRILSRYLFKAGKAQIPLAYIQSDEDFDAVTGKRKQLMIQSARPSSRAVKRI